MQRFTLHAATQSLNRKRALNALTRHGYPHLLTHLARTEELLAQIVVVPPDESAVSHFDRLRATKGLAKIGRADLLIASITLAHRATLVTRNLRHFRQVPGLMVTNWID